MIALCEFKKSDFIKSEGELVFCRLYRHTLIRFKIENNHQIT